jgi:hypothetical protein
LSVHQIGNLKGTTILQTFPWPEEAAVAVIVEAFAVILEDKVAATVGVAGEEAENLILQTSWTL